MSLEDLKKKLKNISSYPDSLKEVCCEIKGLGFFPGARGLWEINDFSLADKSIMVLGHDFGAERDYQLSVTRGSENVQSLTWKNLITLLKEYNLNPKDIFFTNAIMGVRTNSSALGKSPAFDHQEFLKDCKTFLIEQINTQRPNLIIALGQHIWTFLSDVSKELKTLGNIKSFSELDNKELSFIRQVRFDNIPNFTTNIAFITHPTYWHLNVKNRKYKTFVGIEAEKEIIKALINKEYPSQENHKQLQTSMSMNTGNFVIYKITPNELEISGEIPLSRNVDGRLFLNTTIEFIYNLLIFRDPETKKIKGIFSSALYYVLEYNEN